MLSVNAGSDLLTINFRHRLCERGLRPYPIPSFGLSGVFRVGPTLMQPKPLLGFFPNPPLENRVHSRHDSENVRLFISCVYNLHGGTDNNPEFGGSAQTFDSGWNHMAIILQSKGGEGGRCHGGAAEKRRGDPVVHFLVDQHTQRPILSQGRCQFLRPLRAFRDQFVIGMPPAFKNKLETHLLSGDLKTAVQGLPKWAYIKAPTSQLAR